MKNELSTPLEPEHEILVSFGDIFPYIDTHLPYRSGNFVIIDITSGGEWVEACKYLKIDGKVFLGGEGGLPVSSIDWAHPQGQLNYAEFVQALINNHERHYPATDDDRSFYENLYRERSEVSGIIKY